MSDVPLQPETAMRLALADHQAIRFEGRLMKMIGRARDPAQRLIFRDLHGIERDFSDAEILKLQQERKLRILTKAEAELDEDLVGDSGGRPWVTLNLVGTEEETERLRDAALLHLVYVQAWIDAGRPPRTEARLKPIVEATKHRLRDHSPPCARTVLRYIARFLAHGNRLDGLVSQVRNRGNRQDRLEPDARKLLRDTVEEMYLVDTRPTGASVYAHVKRAFRLANADRPAGRQLICPALGTTYAEIKDIDEFTREYCRVGPRSARHLYGPVGTNKRAAFANQVWEIDHTRVNCIAIDERSGLPIGRPWVTVIIDRFSRMIVGIWIAFDAPSAAVVFACLRVAILPKEELLNQHGVAGVWMAAGCCKVLIPDHGSEFKSLAFVEAVTNLGIDVQYTPVLTPWYKGTIERGIQTLSRQTFERMPGSTFANIFERNAEKPPETVAVVGLNEMWRHVLNWVVNVYNKRWHRGLVGVPDKVYAASVARGVDPPINPDRLDAVLTLTEYRSARGGAITYHGITYTSSELADFRIRPRKRYVVKIKVDPADISTICFVDSDDGEIKRLQPQGRFHRMAPRTLESHLLACALQASHPDRFGGDEGIVEAWTVLDDAMREKTAASGSQNRQKARAAWKRVRRVPTSEDPSVYGGISDGGIGDIVFSDSLEQAPDELRNDQSSPKLKRPRKSRATTKPDYQPPEKPPLLDDDFDPEAYSREHGLDPLRRESDDA